MNEQWEEGFADGLDEACRQANEYLEDAKADFRFVNAGLSTVCKVAFDDVVFTQWQDAIGRRQAENLKR